MNAKNNAAPTPTRFARWTPLVVVVLCVAPIASAWWLLYQGDPSRLSAANHGELVSPPIPLQDVELHPAGAASAARASLYGKWSLVYADAEGCPGSCEALLDRMQRIQQALGRKAPRLQRVLLTGTEPSPAMLQAAAGDAGQLLWLEDAERLRDLQALLTGTAENGFVLIDPLGNLLMRYSADSDPLGMIKDLERLLRASRIG